MCRIAAWVHSDNSLIWPSKAILVRWSIQSGQFYLWWFLVLRTMAVLVEGDLDSRASLLPIQNGEQKKSLKTSVGFSWPDLHQSRETLRVYSIPFGFLLNFSKDGIAETVFSVCEIWITQTVLSNWISLPRWLTWQAHSWAPKKIFCLIFSMDRE